MRQTILSQGKSMRRTILSQGKSIVRVSCIWYEQYLRIMKSVLIGDCLGMRRYASKTCIWYEQYLRIMKSVLIGDCLGMRRYASKILSQGKSNKGNLGVHIP